MSGSLRDSARRSSPRRQARERPRRVLGEVEDIEVSGDDNSDEEFTNTVTDGQAQRKRAFLDAMRRTKGEVMNSCESAGISYRTLCRWRKEDPAFKAAFEVEDYAQFDHVQSKLMQAIDRGDVRAITFYLKTKGAKHGYSEKMELTGNMNHQVSFEDHEEHIESDAFADIIGKILIHEDEFGSVEQ